jgi:hypothetical protein
MKEMRQKKIIEKEDNYEEEKKTIYSRKNW